jgi:hypothetical protein
VDLFHQIEDAEAIVRLKGGVYKQTKLFRRGSRIFVQHGGGFARICARWDNEWGTSVPQLKVIGMTEHVPGLSTPADGEPRWTGRAEA